MMNEWQAARDLEVRARQLADDARRAGQSEIANPAKRISREFAGASNTLVGSDPPDESSSGVGGLRNRLADILADVTRLKDKCEVAIPQGRAREREETPQHNGLSVKELSKLLRRIERGVGMETVLTDSVEGGGGPAEVPKGA